MIIPNHNKAVEKMKKSTMIVANQCTCSNCNCNCKGFTTNKIDTLLELYNRKIITSK